MSRLSARLTKLEKASVPRLTDEQWWAVWAEFTPDEMLKFIDIIECHGRLLDIDALPDNDRTLIWRVIHEIMQVHSGQARL